MNKWAWLLFFAASSAQAEKILVTKEFCQYWIQEHVPSDDVAYNPDDYKGVPADIGGAIRIDPPEQVTLNIEIDLPAPLNTFSEHIDVGKIEAGTDGRLYFNGQPLHNESVYKLKEACRNLLKVESP